MVTVTLREAMKLANGHLDYVDYLIDHRAWLAGSTMSMADLAAAAQISVADYLGGIDWTGHEQTKAWYAMFKSRPSFRPLLSELAGYGLVLIPSCLKILRNFFWILAGWWTSWMIKSPTYVCIFIVPNPSKVS